MNIKNLETEINKYIKGNYSKKVAVELLKRDGFSELEINTHLHKFDSLEKTNDKNFAFFPGFVFLLIFSGALFVSAGKLENKLLTTVYYTSFIIALALIYFYYKANKIAIFTTGIILIGLISFEIFSLFAKDFSFFKIFTILVLLILVLSVKSFYKK